jgi:hypothetical protein
MFLDSIFNHSITRSLNGSMVTLQMLPLTIYLISHSIKHLRDHLAAASGSRS